ncbi:MAG: hypothetical protein M3483_02700, partial [Gemmatimonadota bacterium]|nr:hypothetical protein [Gemmatimonadota bacterium]
MPGQLCLGHLVGLAVLVDDELRGFAGLLGLSVDLLGSLVSGHVFLRKMGEEWFHGRRRRFAARAKPPILSIATAASAARAG